MTNLTVPDGPRSCGDPVCDRVGLKFGRDVRVLETELDESSPNQVLLDVVVDGQFAFGDVAVAVTIEGSDQSVA